MTERPFIITAQHPSLGTLYAAVDPAARYCSSKVSELRFAAFLTPFKSAVEAESAFIEAGAHVPEGGAR